METQEFNWTTKEGTTIYAKRWIPKQPKAVICLVHGLGEHINRYQHVADYFGNQGIAMIGNDHVGHGKTSGKRGHTPSYDALLDEVETLIEKAKTTFPNVPIFLYGHSMGGNIVLNAVFRRKLAIQGAIATAPAITLPKPPPKLLVAIGKLTRRFYPSLQQPNGLNPNDISKNKTVVTTYINDPLVHDKISSELGLSLLDNGLWLIKEPKTTAIPLLLMHGQADNITSANGSQTFAKQTKGDVTLKIWDGLFHEIHNEMEQLLVFEYALEWMRGRM